MSGPFFHGVGGVLSADIAVPDHARELAFYSSVLTTGSVPLWRDDLLNDRGQPIIGLGERSPEYEMLPLQWMPHFQVADVAASAARTVEMGGRELLHGKDDGGESQWAALVDPDGAAFGVIPVVPSEPNGAESPGDTGCISWLSLVSADVAQACEFYERVIGLSPAASAAGDRRELQRPGGGAAAEIRARSDGAEGVPSVWLIHLPVGDLAQSLERVRAGGGQTIGEVSEAGRAVIRDPVGVHLALQAHA